MQTCASQVPKLSPWNSSAGTKAKPNEPAGPTTITLPTAAVLKTSPAGDLKLMSSATPGCSPSPEMVKAWRCEPTAGLIVTAAAPAAVAAIVHANDAASRTASCHRIGLHLRSLVGRPPAAGAGCQGLP